MYEYVTFVRFTIIFALSLTLLFWFWCLGRGKEAPAVAPLRVTVALYPASSLGPQTSYLRDFLEHHGSHVAWTFKPYDVLEDLLREASVGDVVVYHGNMTLPSGLHADHAHQGCLYCHAQGNVLLHDAVSRALLSLQVPVTLLPAHDVQCKLSFPSTCRHRVLRGVFGRHVAHAHSLATLPLPTHNAFPHPDTHTEATPGHTRTHKAPSSSSSTAVPLRPALLPSSRRPLTLAVAGGTLPGVASAASLLVSSLSLPLAATATLPSLPSSPTFASTLAKCRFVLLPADHPTAHDTLLAALDAGTIPILLYNGQAGQEEEEGGCDDALGWVRDNGAPVLLSDGGKGMADVAAQLSDIVTGGGKGRGVDGTQAALLRWWGEYKAGVVGSLLAFTIAARAQHEKEAKAGGASELQAQCIATPLGKEEARRARWTYTDYYADPSWFAKGPDPRCASLCDVKDVHCVHVASACFSPDCVPPPIAAFTCPHAHEKHAHKGHAHNHKVQQHKGRARRRLAAPRTPATGGSGLP